MTARWTVYNDKDLWNMTATLDTPSVIKSLGVSSFSSSKVILNSGSDQIHLNGNYISETSPTIYSDIQGASDEIVVYRNGVLRSRQEDTTPIDLYDFVLTEDDYLALYGGDDVFTGSLTSDKDDAVQGLAGDDTFAGYGDDSLGDKFFGGAGNDEAHFRGNKSEYAIQYSDSIYDDRNSSYVSGFTVTDETANRDGIDYLRDVEYLRFSDEYVKVYFSSESKTVSVESSNYTEYGTSEADTLQGFAGSDSLFGGAGSDTLSGGAGNDLIYGNKGADRLVGGNGTDTLFGGQHSDVLFGLAYSDQVYGNKQNDTLYGGQGDDSLFGGQQDDLLYGQVGNDRIDGNRGNDTLFGDDGIDTFVISKGDDWVMDFNTAQDKIETADAYSAITQSVSSGNLVLTDSDGDTLILLGVTSTLSEGYFV